LAWKLQTIKEQNHGKDADQKRPQVRVVLKLISEMDAGSLVSCFVVERSQDRYGY